ncbi:hypothetical protein [Kocuria marina]|uniref:hypothetical protein n=1 Tax=Kocuria marina TaxID=223184 RepID=UPI003F25E0B6
MNVTERSHVGNTAAHTTNMKKTSLHFVWVMLVARIVTGLTISHDLFDGHAWLRPGTWVAPLGFACIWTFVYWTNQKTTKTTEESPR